MATMTVRATYALDPGTVRALEELAKRDGVSKSEALRRAVRRAASGGVSPVAALDALQAAARLGASEATAWAAESRRERRAWSRRREGAAR